MSWRIAALAVLLVGCPAGGPSPGVPGVPGDGDGDGVTASDGDCDDSRPDVFPGAPDVPGDGVDQDCDDADAGWCWLDGDGDGFGGGAADQVDPRGTCTDASLSAQGGDCDDTSDLVFPGGDDLPDDGLDQDCNGVDAASCFGDADADGWGDGDVGVVDPDGNCTDDGQTDRSGDCDDGDPDTHPDAVDPPGDGLDQDCNGIDAAWCYYDGDGDGFGVDSGAEPAVDAVCDNPLLADQGGDCDDSSAAIHPGAEEIVDNGFDDDCSGADATLCLQDGDGDGFGVGEPVVEVDGDCVEPDRAPPGAEDCDDADASSFPFAPEIPDDGIDQDCSGADRVTCWYDGDEDGWGSGTANQISDSGDCSGANLAAQGGDCDDSVGSINPQAQEVPGDGIDNNCDGVNE